MTAGCLICAFHTDGTGFHRTTGNLRFEAFSTPNDATPSANLDSHRLLIEQAGGKAWLHGIIGTPVAGATGAEYLQ